MNVVLVVPPAEKILEKKDTPAYQHVGLGYIAAMLEKNSIGVHFINAKLDRLTFKQTLRLIDNLRPDILGITAMTHEINMAAKLAEEAKVLSADLFTIIGGVHVTALPVETLRTHPCFDFGILGEGEYSFLDLINLVKKKSDFAQLKGVVYRKDSKVLLSQPMERIADLDSLPFPAWHQSPNATEYIIITSRGCPFSCIFCMQASGHKVRKRSANNVVDEIEKVLAERRPERFLFYDETFTLDRDRVYEICNLIIKRGLKNRINWAVTTRVDSINRDLLLSMKEAGCNHIEFGIESGDQAVLNRIQKKITLKQAEHAIGLAKELGLHTEGAFILGHPNETLKTAYKTIHFAARLNLDIAQLGIMVPYPGTEVARMVAEGKGGYKLISNDFSDFNKQLGNALELAELSRLDLERLQLAGYLKLFIFNKRFRDFIKFVWSYRREAISFLRNHFSRNKTDRRSKLSFLSMLKLVFNSLPEL